MVWLLRGGDQNRAGRLAVRAAGSRVVPSGAAQEPAASPPTLPGPLPPACLKQELSLTKGIGLGNRTTASWWRQSVL